MGCLSKAKMAQRRSMVWKQVEMQAQRTAKEQNTKEAVISRTSQAVALKSSLARGGAVEGFDKQQASKEGLQDLRCLKVKHPSCLPLQKWMC